MKLDLQELLEQKALAEKQLQWLNAKIAELQNAGDVDETSPPTTDPFPAKELELEAPTEPSKPHEKEALPIQYNSSAEAQNLARDARRGCLYVFIGVIILMLLIVILWPEWDDKKVEEFQQNAREKHQVETE